MSDNKTIIKDYLKDKCGLNEYRSEQEYQGLHKHKDLEEEFISYILDKWNEDKLIVVEGYNAKELNEKYPLSMLGAYNYLIYLRKNPEEAKENLRKGLPRW